MSEELTVFKGEHRIYLSLAPGLGATRRLLMDAQQLVLEGYRVSLTFRALTTDLVDFGRGISLAPMHQELVQGRLFETFDLEAVLADPPQVVVLGNLAYHTGLPSEDLAPLEIVHQLRSTGIAVWSTVYSYNLTTIAPIYERLTDQTIDVLIPETVIDQASDLILLDPDPDEIIELLEQGQLMPLSQAAIARQTIFRHDVLTQLHAATHALLEIHRPMNASNQSAVWMICIGYNPSTIYMLQRAADLAHRMGAVLLGLHVRPPGGGSSGYELTMQEHLEYAEELCHEVVVVEEKDTATAMIMIAQEYQVSGIFLGRPAMSRWNGLRGNSLLQKLIEIDRNINLFILSDPPVISH